MMDRVALFGTYFTSTFLRGNFALLQFDKLKRWLLSIHLHLKKEFLLIPHHYGYVTWISPDLFFSSLAKIIGFLLSFRIFIVLERRVKPVCPFEYAMVNLNDSYPLGPCILILDSIEKKHKHTELIQKLRSIMPYIWRALGYGDSFKPIAALVPEVCVFCLRSFSFLFCIFFLSFFSFLLYCCFLFFQ
jgi:hypothetical protein